MTSSKQFYSNTRGRFSDQQMGSFYQRFNLFCVDIRSVLISGLRLVCACLRLVHVVTCFVFSAAQLQVLLCSLFHIN